LITRLGRGGGEGGRGEGGMLTWNSSCMSDMFSMCSGRGGGMRGEGGEGRGRGRGEGNPLTYVLFPFE
jgi:hypothetical protein